MDELGKDARPWVKLSLDYFDNPKIDGLSDTAQLLHLQLILRTARQQMDGEVSARAAKSRGETAFKELVSAGLLDKVDPRTYRIHDYLKHQRLSTAPIRRSAIPLDIRTAVYERDGRRCLHCGATQNLSLDHIWPYSKGGPDTYENLQTLCRSCNSKKGARVVERQAAVHHGHERTVPAP